MSPDKRRGTPGQEPLNVADTSKQQQDHGRTPRRQTPPATHALARATRVVGGAGNPRWILLWRCTSCGQQHLSHGRGEALPELLDRRSPHGGTVVLHIAAEKAVAA